MKHFKRTHAFAQIMKTLSDLIKNRVKKNKSWGEVMGDHQFKSD